MQALRVAGSVATASLLFLLVGCSDGGSGGSSSDPLPQWSRFRNDVSGSGSGIGGLRDNPGSIRLSFVLPGGSTLSSPAIGVDGTLYLGTGDGLLAVERDGQNPRQLSGYFVDESGDCQTCTPPADQCHPLGAINSSPAITSDGRIVVGTDAGQILSARDEDGVLSCNWIAPSAGTPSPLLGVRSSPVIIVDSLDDSILTILVGTDAGYLLALNGDGSEKWRFFPTTNAGPLDSSLAVSALGVGHVVAPDGFLYAVDFAGRQLWRFEIGTSAGLTLLRSPAVGASVYAIGNAGLMTALNPDGTLRWRYAADAAVLGSPAYLFQSVDVEDPTPTGTPEPTAVPEGTPSPSAQATPTATPTPETSVDMVVYMVDENGTIYAFRDSIAALESKIALGSGKVRNSPAVTGDAFVLVASEDGFLYAANLTDTVPCEDCEEVEWNAMAGVPAWRVPLGTAARSSPVIDEDGTIYVTTTEGRLLAIGSPLPAHDDTPTPTPLPRPTEAPA